MKFLFALLTLTSTSAFATTTTYQTLTPGAGQSEFRLGVGYRSVTEEGTSGVKADVKGPTIPISYYYGLNDNSSLGVEAGYSSYEYDHKNAAVESSKTYGMENVFVSRRSHSFLN